MSVALVPSLVHRDYRPICCDFIVNMQKASAYLRRFACSQMKEDYKELEEREDKTFPAATTFHVFWTSVDDYILEHWCLFLQRLSPTVTHLSLHFDGVRVNADVRGDVNELVSRCQDHMLRTTGFKVNIVEKKRGFVLENIKAAATICRKVQGMPPSLLENGNCIPCALWHLSSNKDRMKVCWGKSCLKISIIKKDVTELTSNAVPSSS